MLFIIGGIHLESLQNLKEILGDIEINEKQKLALDEFFSELYESLKEKAELEISEDYVLREDAEAAFEAYEADVERAFDLFESDSERAFELFAKDSEAAFELFESDLINEHSQNMTKALEDLYEDLYDKAKEEVLTSPQFESLNKIKDILAPFIIEESDSESLLKENRKLKEALRFINEEKEDLERDQIIESLISELPNKEKNVIKNYIKEAKTIEEIYERYNLAISLLEAKEDDEELDEEEENEDLDEDIIESIEEDEDLLEDSRDPVFYTESKVEVQKPKKKFSSIEEAIISTVFK